MIGSKPSIFLFSLVEVLCAPRGSRERVSSFPRVLADVFETL